jgi:hypothetical protein
MVRDMAKLRNVSGTLVVTLTQAILNAVELKEGDRLVLEAVPPRRVIITKEVEPVANSKRVELEIQILEAKRAALAKGFTYLVEDNKLSCALDNGILTAELALVERDQADLDIQLAEKRLELFDLQG